MHLLVYECKLNTSTSPASSALSYRGAHISPKSRDHVKTLGTTMMARSNFHWRSTNIRRHLTKASGYGDLPPGICSPLLLDNVLISLSHLRLVRTSDLFCSVLFQTHLLSCPCSPLYVFIPSLIWPPKYYEECRWYSIMQISTTFCLHCLLGPDVILSVLHDHPS